MHVHFIIGSFICLPHCSEKVLSFCRNKKHSAFNAINSHFTSFSLSFALTIIYFTLLAKITFSQRPHTVDSLVSTRKMLFISSIFQFTLAKYTLCLFTNEVNNVAKNGVLYVKFTVYFLVQPYFISFYKHC